MTPNRHNFRHITAACLLALLPLFIHAGGGAVEQVHVLSAAGQVSGATNLVNVSCLGQPGLTWITSGGAVQHFGGFLAGTPLQGQLDTDQDGLADELDPDNDNDLLDDSTEIFGQLWTPAAVSSNPNLADTDGDGADDREESIAGTDPTNSGQFLSVRVVEAFSNPGEVKVEWEARNGRTYRVYRMDNLATPIGSPIHTVTHINTSPGPFFIGMESFTDTGAGFSSTARGYYLVEVLP